jgi:hypothetical protein
MPFIKTYFFLLLTLYYSNIILAQNFPLLLNRDNYQNYENILSNNKEFHTSIKPYNKIVYYKSIGKDSLLYKPHHLKLSVTPFSRVMVGYDLISKQAVNDATIGFDLSTALGRKIGLQMNYLRGQGVFPNYLDSIISATSVVPSFGYAWYGVQKNVFVYQLISGSVTYSPNKVFTLEVGNGKHFWGDGYRSLFISDNSYNYPYFKINTKVWKFNYTNLFSNLKDINGAFGNASKFTNKYMTAHYLSYNATRWLNVGLFEAIVFQNRNSNPAKFGYDVNYLNPVIFFRPVEYSLGSADNALVGAFFKIKLFKNIQWYSQLLLDEFYLKFIKSNNGWWANKNAVQSGFKYFDAFNVKGLYVQAEANYVRPYTYSHGYTAINFGHFNQALAHPVGANFYEGIGIVNYTHKRFFTELKTNYLVYGADSSGKNMGQNIYRSYYSERPRDFGNYTTQGIKTTVMIAQVRLSYLLVKSINLRIEASYFNRMQMAMSKKWDTQLFSIGLKTNFINQYLDY